MHGGVNRGESGQLQRAPAWGLLRAGGPGSLPYDEEVLRRKRVASATLETVDPN